MININNKNNEFSNKGKKCFNDDNIQKILIVMMIVILTIFIVLPILMLFFKAFTSLNGEFVGLKNFKEYFANESLVHALKNSMFVAFVSAAIATSLGLIYAYAITRTDIRFKSVFKTLGIVPLFAPSMLYSLSLIYLFGNKGILTSLGVNINLYGAVGIIISEVIYTFPQVFMVLTIGLSMTDNRIYESADVLGTKTLRRFCRITLPSIKYPLISSFFLSFIMAFTDFGAPMVLGGNYNVLATDIYKQIIGQFNMPMGAVISMVMIIPVFIFFIIDRNLAKKQGLTINSKSRSYIIKKNLIRDSLFFSACITIVLIIMILVLTSVIGSFVNLWPYDLSFTLKNYKFKGLMNSGWQTYFNSLKIAICTAIVGTLFTFCSAYLIEKVKKFKVLRNFAYFLSIIPMALPGLVLGLAYILFFNNKNNPLGFLYNTMWIMVMVNVAHYYSVSFVTANTSLKRLDSEYEIVAKSMKVPFYKLFTRVTVPMCLESILEIGIYFFVNSMVTVSALIFLYTPKTQTAAISILKLTENGDGGSAAAMAVLILLTNIIVRLLYEIIKRRLYKNKVWS